MKKFKLLSIFLVLAMMMGCDIPGKSSSTRSLAKSAIGNSFPQQQPLDEAQKKTTGETEKKEPVSPETIVTVELPLKPSNLAGSTYFGIRELKEDEIDVDNEDSFKDRRLTIKFSTPRGGTDLKADFGDEDTEPKSKEAKTKQNLDVKIEGMFITLTDKGQEFLKLEVSKDFQFMFITEDKTTKTELYTKVDYKNTGLAKDGYESHSNVGGYKGPVFPKLPKYPFED